MIRNKNFTADELTRFRDYQRISCEILVTEARQLECGMTEHQVTRRLRKAFHTAGAHNYFHVPVALFGERTAYPGDFGQLEVLRTFIAERVAEGGTFQQIAWEVDDHIRARGFENCHRKRIAAVLGHGDTKATSSNHGTPTIGNNRTAKTVAAPQ